MEREQPEAYISWLQKAESWIMRSAVIGVLALILVQTWHLGGLTNTYFSALERFENGDPGQNAAAVLARPGGRNNGLSLLLVSHPRAPKAKVIVNGTSAADFSAGRVDLAVSSADRVEIAPSPDNNKLTVRVIAAGEDFSHLLGQEFEVRRMIQGIPLRNDDQGLRDRS